MSCYHPRLAFSIGKKENGKQALIWYNDTYEHLPQTYSWGNGFTQSKYITKDDIIMIPCGKCLGCTLDKSRDWANRCLLETQYHKSSYFLTLTYDNEHVPIRYKVFEDTGEAVEHQTLWYKDFQDFMKRLRKRHSGDEIRYFMAGEYGSKTFRPHYHAIVFGLTLDDLELYKVSPMGERYFISLELNDIWSHGFVVVGAVTWESCAYTARYVMKKAAGMSRKFYDDLNIEPEFTHMSNRRGIGFRYYDDHRDLFDYNYINIGTEDGGKKFLPPKYFMRLLENDNPELFEKIKSVRSEAARASMEQKLLQTDLFLDEMLQVEEDAKASKIKSLRRDVV